MSKELAAALRATLISPNEADRNLEPANIVDGLFAIARSIDRLAQEVRDNDDNGYTARALDNIADAIRFTVET